MSEKLSIDASMGMGEAADHLASLISGLRKGTVCIQSGERHVVLEPGDDVHFGIEAVQKEDKGWVEIRLSWRRPEEKPAVAPLIISDVAPAEIESLAEDEPKAEKA